MHHSNCGAHSQHQKSFNNFKANSYLYLGEYSQEIKDFVIPIDEVTALPECFFSTHGNWLPPQVRVFAVPKQPILIMIEIHIKPTVVRQFVDLNEGIIVYFFEEAVMVSVKKIEEKVTLTLKKIS
jgi:hypothetical protein